LTIDPIGVVRRIDQDKARIVLKPIHVEGLSGLAVGDRLDVLYWMHELPAEQRRAMRVHPQGDPSRPRKGVFALRSPMRPNPVGVTAVQVLDIRPDGPVVQGLDAHDGSPVIDLKAARPG